jgi:hypothetical protein
MPKTSQFGKFRNLERISEHVIRERKGKEERVGRRKGEERRSREQRGKRGRRRRRICL